MKHHLEDESLCTPREAYDALVEGQFLHPDPIQEAAVDALQNLYDIVMAARDAKPQNWFQKMTGLGAVPEEAARGIYLYGGVGRGKSMLMDLFYDCLPGDIRKSRVHFHGFMIEVHNYMHDRRESLLMDGSVREGVDEFIPLFAERIAERSRVLCFDEFHVVDVADAMILGRLFTALFDRGVVIVTTSNWEPDRLYEGGLQRDRFLPFIELLKNRMDVFHLDSPNDYRRRKLAQAGTYFQPLGSVTSESVNALFEELTDHAPSYADEIEVKGRKIPVEQVARGCARFTFSQLCERPLGAEDYIAIAEKYKTVFLENIPKMGYDRQNEIKRLMNLIDALYEQRTNVVISADAPPEKLYYGKDHAFEFERTISRLIEMQSANYLKNKA